MEQTFGIWTMIFLKASIYDIHCKLCHSEASHILIINTITDHVLIPEENGTLVAGIHLSPCRNWLTVIAIGCVIATCKVKLEKLLPCSRYGQRQISRLA